VRKVELCNLRSIVEVYGIKTTEDFDWNPGEA